MGNVAAWLRGLGLGKYVKDFEDNEIDFDALPHLTESMLEEIGLPIGPRAKLLVAIARLASAATETEAQREQAERRQITVMFCDLVDSTKLASRLDPEDLRSIMQAYQRACKAIVERYEGHVARYLGDGILAYFGWPTAHEDAADRAVRAGLDIVEAVKALAGPEPLLVRIGISTGIVVIGESGLGDPLAPSDAVGETLHVAARLQNLASPNSVVIAESTHRLVSARFDQEELGPHELKGVPVPVHVFRVRRVQEASIRFHSANIGELTPLVGRRVELAFLRERWRNAKDGEGNVVFVSGVPGIGKSRIVHELERLIEGDALFSLSFQCLPYCMESALFPIIQQIERLGDLIPEDSVEAKLDKIEKLLSPATKHLDKVVPFVAELLSIPVDSRYAPIALPARQAKVQILFVLVDLLLGLSANGPIFCLLEDAQWLDPTTQELLDLAMGQIAKARVLLVVTHRPEYHRHSSSHGNVSELTIPRLGRRAVAEMVQLALRNHPVSTVVVKRIIDESDSIPLFVEELARGAIGSNRINENDLTDQHASPAASWVVPASLRDSLVARLDRAPQARNVAQIAAVVGREFSYDMLLRVSSLSNSELDSALAHLQESEIVRLIDDKPSRYAFRHALLRDVAYDSLLKSNRRKIHSKVGSIISEEWPEIVASQPELLAYHYSLAGDTELAMRYWLRGAKLARDRYANIEATGQYQKALQCLILLPETLERSKIELNIQLSLGLCFIAARGYSADDTRKAFERACELSAELGEQQKELQAIFGLWGHYWMIARHDRAIELGETLLAKATALRDPTTLIVGHRMLGSTLFTFGDFRRAQDHLEQALALGQGANIGESFLYYAVDPKIAALLMLAWDLWILGYPRQALRKVLQALSQASELAEPYGVAFAHYVTSAVKLLRGEAEDSLAHAEQSLAVSKEYRIDLYAAYSRFGRGCALAQMGQLERAIFEIREGIEEAQHSNLGYMRPFMLGWLAALQAETGYAEAALFTIDETLKEINDVKGRAWEAELHRLRGSTLLAARPDAVEVVEHSYRYAIAIAQRQRARSLELRATTSLSRLLRRQNRNQEAHSLLSSIYRWFTEGFDTLDLKEAKALLDSQN
jgi:class 3 adenylate cyclase/predicted ATPase